MGRLTYLGIGLAALGLAIAGCDVIDTGLTIPSVMNTEATSLTTEQMEQQIYQAINQYRINNGLPPFEINTVLKDEARKYSQGLATKQINFDNQNFDTYFEKIQQVLPLENAQVRTASNQGYREPAQEVIDSWLGDPSVQQEITGDFSVIGIGVTTTEDKQYYFTQILARTVPTISENDLRRIEMDTHKQVNAYRRSRGLPDLILDERIGKVAREHSEDMASGAAEFSHDGFDRRGDLVAISIPYRSFAENLAWNVGHENPVKVSVDGWIASPGHHKNMIGEFNRTGMGVARNDRGEYYFTQLFLLER